MGEYAYGLLLGMVLVESERLGWPRYWEMVYSIYPLKTYPFSRRPFPIKDSDVAGAYSLLRIVAQAASLRFLRLAARSHLGL